MPMTVFRLSIDSPISVRETISFLLLVVVLLFRFENCMRLCSKSAKKMKFIWEPLFVIVVLCVLQSRQQEACVNEYNVDAGAEVKDQAAKVVAAAVDAIVHADTEPAIVSESCKRPSTVVAGNVTKNEKVIADEIIDEEAAPVEQTPNEPATIVETVDVEEAKVVPETQPPKVSQKKVKREASNPSDTIVEAEQKAATKKSKKSKAKPEEAAAETENAKTKLKKSGQKASRDAKQVSKKSKQTEKSAKSKGKENSPADAKAKHGSKAAKASQKDGKQNAGKSKSGSKAHKNAKGHKSDRVRDEM